MKKILCFLLTLLLVFNTTFSYTVYAIGFQPSQEEVEKFKQDLLATGRWYEGDDGYLYPKDTAADKLRKFIEHGITVPKLVGEGAVEIAQVLSSFFDNADNYQKNVKTDGQYVYFDNDFTNNINIALQDKVHALNGYYIVDSIGSTSLSSVTNLLKTYGCDVAKLSGTAVDRLKDLHSATSVLVIKTSSGAIHFEYSTLDCYDLYAIGDNKYSCFDSIRHITNNTASCYLGPPYTTLNSNGSFLGYSNPITILGVLGSPLKLFYSLADLNIYYDNGMQRTYVPQLPSGGFKVNIKYINNTTNLPDITYNITTENKTETEIQNQYDATINNYLNGLDNFTDGGGGNTPTPTPTPSGGGSGDFGDGSTPTPTPPLGDGGSDQDGDGANGWLKKIYDQLVKLSDSVSQHFEKEETFEDKISKYLESHDKKFDAIVDAIDKLSQGKEEGEEKGCKYDYTKLSDFMTKLWNDSDQKFDQMVELLKENNEYQEKMLSTLNSIKNILLAQTVMDAFKNRSSETANKAKEKFPTSVPWDIALIVNAMDAEPKAPVFELPVKIERLNIDEKITVDISSGEWEKLAKACRYMLSLLFVLFMVNLTRKLFFSKGDD